jgi:hypothetical protein
MLARHEGKWLRQSQEEALDARRLRRDRRDRRLLPLKFCGHCAGNGSDGSRTEGDYRKKEQEKRQVILMPIGQLVQWRPSSTYFIFAKPVFFAKPVCPFFFPSFLW